MRYSVKKDQKRCGKLCEGRILNKARGLYCACLEKKLPKPSRQSIKALSSDKIEIYHLRLWLQKKEMSLRDIIETLKQYGLGTHEIKLVYYRVIKEMTFRDLVKKQGWLNSQQAAYHYKQALWKLRVGGFRLK